MFTFSEEGLAVCKLKSLEMGFCLIMEVEGGSFEVEGGSLVLLGNGSLVLPGDGSLVFLGDEGGVTILGWENSNDGDLKDVDVYSLVVGRRAEGWTG